ncbi:hypothetical protein BKA70DRAFT_1419593 [Coprinopsis sp. MPI-PUGE-AT-0042]|nr:hypothetical protein BKA70DRAFT_1419593 [Coprinopsis sp. MPI-PUGE-AT-0042]
MNPYLQWSDGETSNLSYPHFSVKRSDYEGSATDHDDPGLTFFGYNPELEEFLRASSTANLNVHVSAQLSNEHTYVPVPEVSGSTIVSQHDPHTFVPFAYPQMPSVHLPYVASAPFHGSMSQSFTNATLTHPASVRPGLIEQLVMPTLQEYIFMVEPVTKKNLLCAILAGQAAIEKHVRRAVDASIQSPHILRSLLRFCYPDPSDHNPNLETLRGWRTYFDTMWITEIRQQIILPLASKLWDELRHILLQVIDYIIKHVLSDDRIFPEFRHDSAWPHELRKTLLRYGVSGGYLHFYFKKDSHRRPVNPRKRTEDVIHESAVEAYEIACAISSGKDCPDGREGGVFLYRHGGVILAHRCLMNNVAQMEGAAFTDYVTLMNGSDGPPILHLLKLPIALVSATLYTCYIRGSLAIQPEDVLDGLKSQHVLCTKLHSVGKAFDEHASLIDEAQIQYLYDAIRRPINTIIRRLPEGIQVEDAYSGTVLPQSTGFVIGIDHGNIFTGSILPQGHTTSSQLE